MEFLYEIGTLRLIPRQWARFLNTGTANLAEHHFRVMWLALIIAKYEGVKNTEKVLKMALVHDIAESRTVDVDYLSRQYVERNEELGIKDMLKNTAIEKEFLELSQEYEERKSKEAQIVKDADNLDIDMEIREQLARGNSLAEEWKGFRSQVKRNNLYTKTAKKIWVGIYKSDPHDWHTKGRNRIKAGDWKV